MVSLKDRKWKGFDFVELFDIQKGFYNKKPTANDKGNIPFLGATESNNGITSFHTMDDIKQSSKMGHDKNVRVDKKIFTGNCIAVTNDGSVGHAFYQKVPFTCSHSINPLYLKIHKLNEKIALFLIRMIEMQGICFQYSRKWRPERMKKSKILLPIDNEGEPDWLFMENYIKQLESNQKEEYKNFATKKLQDLEYKEIPTLKEKTWKAFRISKLFEIENCKCSNISSLKNGDVPYIGATNRNNGILKFVENRQDLLTKGRCIVFICDGEGSIGYSTYQDADFIGSTTLKVGRNSNMNKYHIMFISTISDKVRTKYNFGYKRTTAHLKNEMILLPLGSDNTPDYDYMEQYIKNVMYKQLTSYLEICK